MRNNNGKQITKTILTAIGTGTALYIVFSSPGGTRRILKGIKEEWNKKRALEALDRLRRRKLVAYRYIKKGEIEVELTDAGEKKIRFYSAEEISPKQPRRWDGVWRIILSDIPESKKKARDALRQKFHAWGFYPLQKSVFIYPFPCEDEIAIMRDLFEIPTNNLIFIEVKHIADEAKLKKNFGLKK